MSLITKSIRMLLIVLNIFLALTAIGGGIQLLAGIYVPPVEMLNGSIFKDFTIPGLALGLVVGGSAVAAAVLWIRKNPLALVASIAAGLIIMFFEFVEMLVIGSPFGPARFMQIFYFGMGTVLISVSVLHMFLETVSNRGALATAS